MPKKVNYTADLLYLKAQVTTLMSNLGHPVDPVLFAETIDRDVHFVATTCGRIFRSLRESSFRKERLQVLIDLRSVAILIVDLFDAILEQRTPISRHLADQMPRYRRIRESVMDMSRDLDHQVIETSRGREEGGPVVSEEELMHLLAEAE